MARPILESFRTRLVEPGRIAAPALSGVRDLAILTKPRVTSLVVCTAMAGAGLAPHRTQAARVVAALVGTTLMVAAANVLNMWLERDVDALMARTRDRPLPSGRLAPRTALAFGAGLALVATLLLAASCTVTVLLGLAALALYVGAYTPLKRRTDLALLVGAVPGALPPLMGWSAAAGAIEWRGALLFALVFAWQLVHVAAIAIARHSEYLAASMPVVSVKRGPTVATRTVRAAAPLVVAVSLVLLPVGLGGSVYAAAAVAAGGALLGCSLLGKGGRWARRVFIVSNVYLAVLLLALVVDRMIGAVTAHAAPPNTSDGTVTIDVNHCCARSEGPLGISVARASPI
jgi:protoheme IX farnesyltransferase